MVEPYKHVVQYYETDKMGITHHSNYIRWMEEARVYYLEKIGWPMTRLEKLGMASPVAKLNCDYKAPTTFSDVITIRGTVTEFKGVKLVIHYEMTNEEGKTVCVADSVHCFIDTAGRPVRVDKAYPEFYASMLTLSANEE